MSRDMRLDKERRLLGVDTSGEIDLRDLDGFLPEFRWVLRYRDRMHINHAENRLVLVLKRQPLLDGTEVITEMEIARWLNARKKSVHSAHF